VQNYAKKKLFPKIIGLLLLSSQTFSFT